MSALAYYNEIDSYCAAWLQNLMDAGHIASGVIDTRSIEDVRPDELAGYTQCHFFAGLGGWAYALDLAGWPRDRPVWTGSCPCQPFSAAGKGHGFADERHLWPAWQHLISQCLPPVVFGEQVETAIKHGWLDLVQDDLEGTRYAFAAVGLPAASVGARHDRRRIWFVADAHEAEQHERAPSGEQPVHHRDAENFWREAQPSCCWVDDGVPRRMEHVGAYGNAIVPQVAQAFIESYCEARNIESLRNVA